MDQGVPINKQLAEKISADLSASDKLCIDFVNAYMDVATGYTAPPAGASEIDTEYKNAGQAVAFGEKSVKEAAKEYVAKAKEIVDKNKK